MRSKKCLLPVIVIKCQNEVQKNLVEKFEKYYSVKNPNTTRKILKKKVENVLFVPKNFMEGKVSGKKQFGYFHIFK